MRGESLSDLTLANIEALAQNEEGTIVCATNCYWGYCGYVVIDGTVTHILFYCF